MKAASNNLFLQQYNRFHAVSNQLPYSHYSTSISWKNRPISSSSSSFPNFNLKKRETSPVTMAATSKLSIPATDRVIDFGKHKGNMLGTLPSAYLKWISQNLRAGDTLEWAHLADQVLNDPVYKDRIEWESAQKLLDGDSLIGTGKDSVAGLLELSKKFGWDNEDRSAWNQIDFSLLGTSKGGRIPRLEDRDSRLKKLNESSIKKSIIDSGKRKERIERSRLKRDPISIADNTTTNEDPTPTSTPTVKIDPRSRFPGRASLVKKALNFRKNYNI
ncbi:uncharacterized protein LOC124937634 [Impatiens glandulifera]|uniref:uncharacterized protein LOC124937634 n=1 Tax=Impatiens glandulifera TaxID=253017 RepID=UPI001FB05169|nr:uncharacterized protein LOC124937634 [Impatiens glandulifera]